AITQLEFNLSTVAAVLMIAGYSINDTVVVFDRIREDLRKYKKKPIAQVFNLAINQTLSRTLMTSLTTLLALIALYVFGGAVIQGFVYALIFGIVVGTYSSIFVAAPLLTFMKIKRGEVNDPAQAQEA
ncbi:MAG: protein translocase subunit SecF, partial [Bdellovibrionales bacterium]